MSHPLVLGRETEHERARGWLGSLNRTPGTLVIAGEGGIGKSTLWTAIADDARQEGFVVCAARSVASEARLAFSVLIDLVEPLLAWLDELPPPQRRGLSAALLLTDDVEIRPEIQPDLRSVAVAVTSLVRQVGVPVLLAIDDVQWLDPSSRTVIDYLRRRLPDGAGLLVTERSDATVSMGPPDIELGSLNLGVLHHVIRTHVGWSPPRPVLVRIEQLSRGNPVLATELARVAVTSERELSVPTEFSALVGRRLAPLPDECRQQLLRLAASGDHAIDLEREPTETLDALRPAVAAALVEVHHGAIRYCHPLYEAAVLENATPAQRRSVHASLAEMATDEERRGRHLALSADGVDETLALALDRSVEATRRRGATADALELASHAVRLSPAGPDRLRRLLTEAELAFQAGDSTRALTVAEEVTEHGDDLVRSRAWLFLARVRYESSGALEAVRAARMAMDVSPGDPGVQLEGHLLLAAVDYTDFEARMHHSGEARAILSTVPDVSAALRARALLSVAATRADVGLGVDLELFEQAVEAERDAPAGRVAERARATFAAFLKYADDLDRARDMFIALREEALAEGDDSSVTYVVSHLPQLELWAGRWGDAERWAVEHVELADQMAQTSQRAQAQFNLGLVRTHQGRIDEALGHAALAGSFADQLDDDHLRSLAWQLEGYAAVASGEPSAAVEPLERSIAVRRRLGLREPGAMRSHGDAVEALVAAGRLDDAVAVADELDVAATRARRRSAAALVRRSRACIATARAELDEAVSLATQAASEYVALAMPFDAARSHLVQGIAERRGKHRGAARVSLELAAEGFLALGAASWHQRAVDELARLGRSRGSSTELTDGELAVAQLAARGMTNREVAAALFMSPKTVEANLARVYRKLGIASRAELGARLGRT